MQALIVPHAQHPFALKHTASQVLSRAHVLRTAPVFRRQRQTLTNGRMQRCIVCAASASGGAEDPYKVLGISRDSDFKAAQRAYNRKRSDAKGNEVELQRLEAAYNKLFMGSLTARLQGNVKVAKDIKFADKPKYFPWRPRQFMATKNFILVILGLQAATCAWALLSPATAGQQPIITSSIIGAISNIFKQNKIFPPPSGSSGSEEAKQQGFKNILRGTMLAFMATFLGCFIAFTIPDYIASLAKRVLPYWFYEWETSILTVGTCTANVIMSSCFR